MSCQKCNSQRVLRFSAKCSDMFDATIGTHEHDGYVPGDLGIGRGDYIDARVCLDCGQMQGTYPLPLSEMESAEADDETDDCEGGEFMYHR